MSPCLQTLLAADTTVAVPRTSWMLCFFLLLTFVCDT